MTIRENNEKLLTEWTDASTKLNAELTAVISTDPTGGVFIFFDKKNTPDEIIQKLKTMITYFQNGKRKQRN